MSNEPVEDRPDDDDSITLEVQDGVLGSESIVPPS